MSNNPPAGRPKNAGPESSEPWLKNPLHDKLISLVHHLIENEIDLQFAKKELEAAYIEGILRANGGSIGLSAKALGMHRNTLSKRIKELKIALPN